MTLRVKHSQLTHGIVIAPSRGIAAALMLIDKAGTLLRKRRPRPSRIDKVLLVFFGSFGDGLMFTSILKPLREHMPEARIDVLASKDVGAVLAGNPHISNLFVTDMPSGKAYPKRIPGLIRLMRSFNTVYDAALCLRQPIDNGILPLFLSGIARFNIGFATGGFSFCLDEVVPWRAGIHETEHMLDAIRALCPQCQLGPQELFYDTAQVGRSLDEKLDKLGIAESAEWIVVHPGSKVMRRSLSVERWREVLSELVEKTSKTILVTGIGEEKSFYDRIGIKHPRVIPTLGMFSIPELTELIKRSCGVVTVETFASHLAGYAGVPALAFWTGVTDVRQWRPVGKNVKVVTVDPPCAPCFKWCDDPICMHHDPSAVVHITNSSPSQKPSELGVPQL